MLLIATQLYSTVLCDIMCCSYGFIVSYIVRYCGRLNFWSVVSYFPKFLCNCMGLVPPKIPPQSINQSIFVYSELQDVRTQIVTLVSRIFIYVFICMSPCPFWISFNLILSDVFRIIMSLYS